MSPATSAKPADTRLGAVAELWVFPVKSMRGVRVDAVDVHAGGLAGDRAWAVQDAVMGGLLTAAEEPRLREVRPVPPGSSGGALALELTGADRRTDVDEALSAYLGRPVRLVMAVTGTYVDVAPVHLVSRRTVRAAVADPHDPGCACSLENPRANVVLALDENAPGERSLVGLPLRLGGAVLRVSRPPEHCLGVYAEVVQAGRVAVGDAMCLRR